MCCPPFLHVDLVGAVLEFLNPVQQARLHLLVFPTTTPQPLSEALRTQARNWVDARASVFDNNTPLRLEGEYAPRPCRDASRHEFLTTVSRAAHVNFLPWLMQDKVLERLRHRDRLTLRDLMKVPGAQGHLFLLQWWHAHLTEVPMHTGMVAAANGHRHVVEWMHRIGI